MSMKQKAILSGFAIAFLSISACQAPVNPPPSKLMAGQHHGKEDKRVFSISIYTDTDHPDQCLADWPAATLWKSSNQTVEWVSDDGGDYSVDFTLGHNGSPFSQSTFYVSKNGVAHSGNLTQSGKYYDYGIRAGDPNGKVCKPASDPGLYVK
jgi:hypothetical protein